MIHRGRGWRHLRRMLFAATSVLGLGMTACGPGSTSAATRFDQRPAVPVGIATMKISDDPLFVRKTARLEPRIDIELSVESAGVVIRRHVKEGTSVRAGEPVLALADAAERAEVQAARSRLTNVATGPTELAMRETAEATLALAEEHLRRRLVVAPVSGILDRYRVDEGEHVVPGMPIARLVDPERVFAIATVLEADILQIDPDQRARVMVAPHAGIDFPAEIVRIARAAQPRSGSFEVEVEVEPDPRLRAGFNATIDLPILGTIRRRTIPRDAVFVRHGTERVFVVENEGGQMIARETAVVTSPVPWRPDLADVTEGLEEGAAVVVRGRLGLVSGDRVVPELDERRP